MQLKGGERILDLACGFGRHSLELARRGIDVTGVDITRDYVIPKALKSGGKHFMDIMNGSYAVTHFPCKLWDVCEKCLAISNFEWDNETKTLIYGRLDYAYGEPLPKPVMEYGNTIRLYNLDEVGCIFGRLGMTVLDSYADFSGKPSSDNDIQLMVCSIKS